MSMYKCLLCALAVSIFSCHPFLEGLANPPAQNQKKAADSVVRDEPDKDKTSEQPLRERAKLILCLLSQESRQWEKKDIAAELQAQIADLLWESDAAPARDILVYAWETAKSVKDKKQERSAYRNQSKRVEVMRQVM